MAEGNVLAKVESLRYFLYRLQFLYALDIQARLQHQVGEETGIIFIGVVATVQMTLLCCLFLAPGKLVDLMYKCGVCWLATIVNTQWISSMLMGKGKWEQQEVSSECGCPLEVPWIDRRISDFINTIICQCLATEYLNLHLYSSVTVALVVISVLLLLVSFVNEAQVKILSPLVILILINWPAANFTEQFTSNSFEGTNFVMKALIFVMYLLFIYIYTVIYTEVVNVKGYTRWSLFAGALFLDYPVIAVIFQIVVSLYFALKFLTNDDLVSSALSIFDGKLSMRYALKRHWKNILSSIFFYAMFNIIFNAMFVLLQIQKSERLTETLGLFCGSWVGSTCLLVFVFFVSRGLLAASVFYLRGFQQFHFRIGSPSLSDGFILVFLTTLAPNEKDIYGLYVTIGLFLVFFNLLNDLHSLADPVLMEMIANKSMTTKQIMIFIFFVFLGILPVFAYMAIPPSFMNLSVWLQSVLKGCFVLTILDCMASIVMYFLMRCRFMGKLTPIRVNFPLDFSLVCHGFHCFLLLLWSLSSFSFSVFGVVMPVLSICFSCWQLYNYWHDLKERRKSFKRLLWKPCKWDKNLSVEGSDISSFSCYICLCRMTLGALNVLKLSCGHAFHESCLQKWCGSGDECPCIH